MPSSLVRYAARAERAEGGFTRNESFEGRSLFPPKFCRKVEPLQAFRAMVTTLVFSTFDRSTHVLNWTARAKVNATYGDAFGAKFGSKLA